MHITKSSYNLISIIKNYEGLVLEAYKDPVGIWTIGYGFTYYPKSKVRVKQGDKITLEQADSMLKELLLPYELGVDNTTRDDISQGQFDALVDFSYNAGLGNLRTSSLLKLINEDPNTTKTKIIMNGLKPRTVNVIHAKFLEWNKAGGKVFKGLTKRRECEALLFTTNKLTLI